MMHARLVWAARLAPWWEPESGADRLAASGGPRRRLRALRFVAGGADKFGAVHVQPLRGRRTPSTTRETGLPAPAEKG